MIEAVHTPGHRPEHTSFVLRSAQDGDAPWALLSGDSLFAGDVARPDLAIEKAEGARQIYRSLHERLLALPDDVELWPGHLGGSMCGSAAIENKTSSTIGHERAHNEALRIADEAGFVEHALASIGARPPNVEHIVALNQGPFVEEHSAPVPLAPRGVESAVADGAIVVDARTNEQFDEAHIPGAISASAYDTGFATKVAQVTSPESELIVVAASDGYEAEAAELLGAVGLRVRGFLEGGMTSWRSEGREVERIELIDVEELAGAARGPDAAARPRRPKRRRVRARPHPGLAAHPLRRTARAPGRAAPRAPDRGDLLGREAQRARRLGAPARGIRAGGPRRPWRRGELGEARARAGDLLGRTGRRRIQTQGPLTANPAVSECGSTIVCACPTTHAPGLGPTAFTRARKNFRELLGSVNS